MLESFDIDSWTGPFAAETRSRAQSALENGGVLYFPRLAFALSGSEAGLRDARLSDGKAKNISLDPESGKLQGSSAAGELALRLAAMMERFGAGATGFVRALLPNYGGVERARTSYRPVEVEGRAYSVLQEPEKAKTALADARKALAGDATALGSLDALAHELGLGS